MTLTLIVDASARDQANAALEAAGFGPGNFSLALSATGLEPGTHFAAYSEGFTEADYERAEAALGGIEHEAMEEAFDLTLAEKGLRRIELGGE